MFKAVAAVAVVVMTMLLLGGGLWLYTHADVVGTASELTHVRDSGAFKVCERSLSLDPQLNKVLGGNMKFGEVVLKSGKLGDQDSGPVMLELQVSGANGAGRANVKVINRGFGTFSFAGGDYFPTSGPPLHLDAH